MPKPSDFSCCFMYAMLSYVHFAGGTPFAIAAFSAGRPNASQPIGCSTLWPCMRMKRVSTSPIV
jgi:hypothetical protein